MLLILYRLLKNHANVLIGKNLAVVCFDSGPLRLTGEEKIKGWHEKKDIAYSPKLTPKHIDDLFYEQYDQWCLFTQPTEFKGMTGFVNYGGFSLAGKEDEFHEQLVEEFWEEILNIDPFNFIADGDN